MSLPRELIRGVRALDEYQLRRLLIFVRGLLVGSQGPAVELSQVPGVPPVTYRRQAVRCGKNCGACPHGPYWYAFWKEDGRSRSQYIGAVLPSELRRLVDGADAERRHPRTLGQNDALGCVEVSERRGGD